MAKNSTATSTATDTAATEQGTPETTAETTARAKRGSTIEAQCKDLVRALAIEFNKDGVVADDTKEWLLNVASQLKDKAIVGATPEVKLAHAEAERAEVWNRSATVENGAFVWANPEDEARFDALSVTIKNLKAAIAKKSSPATA